MPVVVSVFQELKIMHLVCWRPSIKDHSTTIKYEHISENSWKLFWSANPFRLSRLGMGWVQHIIVSYFVPSGPIRAGAVWLPPRSAKPPPPHARGISVQQAARDERDHHVDRQQGRPTGQCFPTVGHNGPLPWLPDESVAEPKSVVPSPPGQWRARPTPSTALLPVRVVFFLPYSFHTKILTFSCCQVFSALTKENRSPGYL